MSAYHPYRTFSECLLSTQNGHSTRTWCHSKPAVASLVETTVDLHNGMVTDAIPTRTVRLQPWLTTSDVEACFPTQRQGVLILKDRGQTLLDESLSIMRLQNRPLDGSFWTTHAQRMPDGGYALASSRSKQGEKNLQLFDDLGRFQTSFPIGDGIEHLAVDGRGRIWVGYFDEGIFGGDPLSSHGLSRFDRSGKLEYQWDYSVNVPIYDCDALTLDETGRAWVCPYTRYFVAVIAESDARIILPEAPVSIICGLLTGRTHVGFLGGTDFHGVGDKNGVVFHVEPEGTRIEQLPKVGPEPTDKASVVTIVSLKTRTRRQVQVLDENSAPIPFRNKVSCRAGTAVCWTNDRIYRFTLDDLLIA